MTASDPSSSNRVRVLLVDDHPVLRRGMKAMIDEEPDMRVCGEADGMQSAIDQIRFTEPHVVIVDLSIKDGDGLELIGQIRQRWPAIKSLVLSMFDEVIYAHRALRAGAMGYIMKGRAATSVIEGIRSIVGGQIFVSDEVRASLQPGRDAIAAPPTLSDRELQVVRCIGKGLDSRQIGQALFISPKTVEAHRENIKHKLGLPSSGDLLRYAIEYNRLNG
ncbi:MAG TPA: response regulator transcription factor [Humisphaera sp.]|jgi:DNA-binding NarL/FixJ family response regulator|nr:response regulator transcription factor [Humisphaera sp.]